MKYLNEKVMKDLEGMFKAFKNPVTIKLFTQEFECRYCEDTRGLVEELSAVNDKIKLEVYDFVKDSDTAKEFGIDKIPALVLMNEQDAGIRFFGIPAGYEFTSLVEALKMVSSGQTELSDDTKKYLDGLEKDVHLQVFVTPTCPYCPKAVIQAHQMALYSPKVRADMVEASEFPYLSQRYNVMGVPKTVINEDTYQEGAAPEKLIIDKIKESLKG